MSSGISSHLHEGGAAYPIIEEPIPELTEFFRFCEFLFELIKFLNCGSAFGHIEIILAATDNLETASSVFHSLTKLN